MGDFILIRPKDDAPARQAATWGNAVAAEWISAGHPKVHEVDDTTPADRKNVDSGVSHLGDVVCYFGHGTEDEWQTGKAATLDTRNASSAAGKTVVSVACKTGSKLGPAAVTAGVEAWLGFTIRIAAVPPFGAIDPFQDAFVEGLKPLGNSLSVQDARDELANQFAGLAKDYDVGGLYHSHPDWALGYFAAAALSTHVVAHGNVHAKPL